MTHNPEVALFYELVLTYPTNKRLFKNESIEKTLFKTLQKEKFDIKRVK